MGNSKINKKIKIIPDLERIIPDELTLYSRRLLCEHMDRYNFAAAYIYKKKVVDVACGSGYGSYLLAKKGARKVIAIDCDQKIITYARTRYPRYNVVYKIGDTNNLTLASKSVDVVISFETIEHLIKPLLFLSEVKRILKKDGLLIISTPNYTYSMRDNPFHYKEFTISEYIELLHQNFDGEIILYGQRPIWKPIMFLYRIFSYLLPQSLHSLLHMRPWEKLKIKRIKNTNDDGYVYFIAICKK